MSRSGWATAHPDQDINNWHILCHCFWSDRDVAHIELAHQAEFKHTRSAFMWHGITYKYKTDKLHCTCINVVWLITFESGVAIPGQIFVPQRHKTNLLTCASSEDSDQPAHSRRLIRIITGRILDSQGFSFSSCGQRWFWSDCADAHVQSNLLWAHMSKGTFANVAAHSIMRHWVLHKCGGTNGIVPFG